MKTKLKGFYKYQKKENNTLQYKTHHFPGGINHQTFSHIGWTNTYIRLIFIFEIRAADREMQVMKRTGGGIQTDEFLEKFQGGGGGALAIQKFILQIFDLYTGL